MKFIRKQGFTLIEVVIVMAILLLLMSTGMPLLRQALTKADGEIQTGTQRKNWQMAEIMLRDEIQGAFGAFSPDAFSRPIRYHEGDHKKHDILPVVLFYPASKTAESSGQMRYIIYDISEGQLTRKVWKTKEVYLPTTLEKGELTPGYFFGNNIIFEGIQSYEVHMEGNLLYLKLEADGANVIEWIIRIPQWIPIMEGSI